MNSAAQAKCKDFMGQSIIWIREEEYKPTHADTKGDFHFYEWKRTLHKHSLVKVLNEERCKTKWERLFYMSISCKGGKVRNLAHMIPKTAVSPLH